MKLFLLHIFSYSLLVSGHLFAQEEADIDTTKITVNSGLQVYVDYGKLLTIASNFESKWEVGLSYQFKFRLQPNFFYGRGSIEPAAAIENGTYKSEGSYWRVGLNYIIPLDNTNLLYVGVKYSESQFDDSGSYQIKSELWEVLNGDFARGGHEAQWAELIIGSEKKLKNNNIILGGKTGVRLRYSRTTTEFIDIYTMPGYGLASDSSTPFFNVYIKYHFGI